jgi:hypothetical protein
MKLVLPLLMRTARSSRFATGIGRHSASLTGMRIKKSPAACGQANSAHALQGGDL